ncbi:MAG: peptidoglycan DD-metalloendopeptidase family protein [Candidatus Paceibacterota bacterium]|jgi:murein DD-endopeptidase MepM/ murein hydrolase activator NlpD
MAQQSHFGFRKTEKPLKNKLIYKKPSINDQERGSKSEGQSIKSLLLAIYTQWFIVLLAVSLTPATTNAGVFSFISDFISEKVSNNEEVIEQNFNSQNLPLLQSAVNSNLSGAVGGGDITIVDNEALVSESGPTGTLADMSDTVSTGQISKYIVRKGDTLSGIANMFGVSTNTIVWANNVNTKTLKEGQVLVILPVSGTIHTVAKGDTLSSIAKKYKADSEEILQFNNLDSGLILAIGDSIIIPDGEGVIKVSGTTVKKASSQSNPYRGGSGPTYEGYYMRPVVGGVRTQGIHGYNGIDIASYIGTPIVAAASGEVIISRSSGWNGGYGQYVVISHSNGTQTLYGHLSENYVYDGQSVVKGQAIGLMGSTGKSTGSHLHFEIRGAKNPF